MTESAHVLALVRSFISDLVYPAEPLLVDGGSAATACMRELQQRARDTGLWALPLPVALGGGGVELARYAPVAEVEGSSDYGPTALGSDLLLDATMLDQHGSAAIRERFLRPMVAGQARPSFGMTEPGVAGSDPSGLQTVAEPDGAGWVIRGRKCVRVPGDHLLGPRGGGLGVAAQRLALGRTLRCLRWLGQTARAYDVLCDRLVHRHASGGPLADKQLMQQHAFDSHVDLAAARAMTRAAVDCLVSGADPAIAVGTARHQGVASTRPDNTASAAARK